MSDDRPPDPPARSAEPEVPEGFDFEPSLQPDEDDQDRGEQIGFGGLGDLLRQVLDVNQQLAQGQPSATEETVEGSAGGGVVKVELTGALECRTVRIDPAAVDPDDLSWLEDLVGAAINDALRKAVGQQGEVAGDVGDLFGAGDLLGRMTDLLGEDSDVLGAASGLLGALGAGLAPQPDEEQDRSGEADHEIDGDGEGSHGSDQGPESD